MDWSKAKNILIIALVATNMFLLFTYLSKNDSQEIFSEHEGLINVLESNNIYLHTEIPTDYNKLSPITITYDNKKEKAIQNILKTKDYCIDCDNFDEALAEISEKEIEKLYKNTADELLKDCKIDEGDLQIDKFFSKGNGEKVVRYINVYDETAIGDSNFDVVFQDGKIIEIKGQLLKSKEKSKKKLDIILPEEALLILMSEKEKEEIINIKNIELVYWTQNLDFEGEMLISDTAFPAWEIRYNEEEIKYITAYKS